MCGCRREVNRNILASLQCLCTKTKKKTLESPLQMLSSTTLFSPFSPCLRMRSPPYSSSLLFASPLFSCPLLSAPLLFFLSSSCCCTLTRYSHFFLQPFYVLSQCVYVIVPKQGSLRGAEEIRGNTNKKRRGEWKGKTRERRRTDRGEGKERRSGEEGDGGEKGERGRYRGESEERKHGEERTKPLTCENSHGCHSS